MCPLPVAMYGYGMGSSLMNQRCSVERLQPMKNMPSSWAKLGLGKEHLTVSSAFGA